MPTEDEPSYEEFLEWRAFAKARRPRTERTVLELWDEYVLSLIPGTGLAKNRPGFRKFLLLEVAVPGELARFGDLRPSQLDERVYKAWVRAIYETRTNRGGPPAPGRVENVRVALQACFTFHRREIGQDNPLKGLDKQPGFNRRRLGYFTPDQLDHFCVHLPPLDAAILRVEFLTLQRESTIRCLRKREVDWTSRDLLLVVKGGAQERVVCPDPAFEIVQAWAQVSRSEFVFPNPRDPLGNPLPYTTWRHHLEAAEKASGIQLGWAHAARHGGARNLLSTTALPLISQQLCHKDLKTTAIYLGVSEQLREVLRASMNAASKPK